MILNWRSEQHGKFRTGTRGRVRGTSARQRKGARSRSRAARPARGAAARDSSSALWLFILCDSSRQGKSQKKHFNFFTCLKRAENRVDPSKDHFKFITSLWVNWKYFCVQSIVQAQFAARFRLGIANQWRLKLIRQSSTLQVKIHRERLKRL